MRTINKLLETLTTQIVQLKALEKYVIEFGITTDVGTQILEVNILNTDDTISKMDMFVGDILWLTEYGTMTIPARPVLEKIKLWILRKIPYILDDIVDGIMYENWSNMDIQHKFIEFEFQINSEIKNIFDAVLKSNNTLADLLDVDDENRYLVSFDILKNYISCRIYQK